MTDKKTPDLPSPLLDDGTASDWTDDGSDETTVDRDDNESPVDSLWRDAWVAVSFLTRLPLPAVMTPPAYRDGSRPVPPLADVARAFPLAGLVVGVVGAVALGLASAGGMHPLAAALVGLGAGVLVTGALHEDGLADVADGFGGGAAADDKKTIMRDSRIGTYGVLAVIFSIGLRAGLLMSFFTPGDAAFALVGAAVMGRAVLPALMHLFAPARGDGLGHDAGRPTETGAMTAAGLGLLIGFLCFGFWGALFAGAFALAAAYGVGALARRQIGGITGDVLGAAEQVAEVAALVGVVVVAL